jgi:hypothetical protein
MPWCVKRPTAGGRLPRSHERVLSVVSRNFKMISRDGRVRILSRHWFRSARVRA